jgi:prostaglandin-H2 D-isomerase / glutathione transferase
MCRTHAFSLRVEDGALFPTEPSMPTTTLTYFDIPTSRGEECRLALHLAGVPFTDERLKPPDWHARRANAPFGALPVLTVEGHPPLGQSNTILRLIGKQHGLLPTDVWESARHEAVMDSVEDMRHRMGPISRLKDEAEKKRQREEAAREYLPQWASFIEKQIAGPFVGGQDLSVADLKLFVVLGAYLKGAIDHVPATVFAHAPKLLALFRAVQQHPKVVSWYARSA